MMTAARLEAIRNRWIDTQGFAAQDVRDLLTAIDAHREAVRVAVHAHRARLDMQMLEDGLCQKVFPVPPLDQDHPLRAMLTNYGFAQLDCVAAEEAFDKNEILAAAIKSAQEGQQ